VIAAGFDRHVPHVVVDADPVPAELLVLLGPQAACGYVRAGPAGRAGRR
jgi:hypothetical protein